MPVLRFLPERLRARSGAASIEELRDALFRLKCETDMLEDGYLEVEINPDRPDMYSEEGIARAVKGLLGLEYSWRPPRTADSGITLRAGEVPSRPYIGAAVVRGVNIEDEEDLRQLIQFQEKLHDTIGRRRRKAAIGFHDLSKLPSGDVEYVELDIDEVSMVPLGGDTEVVAGRVLEETDQGLKYGSIALRGRRHPFLLSGGKVIAMPPVINSEITRIEPGTRDLFIDVTGTDLRTVKKILDIIVSNLYERGATVYTVKVVAPYGTITTPTLETGKIDLDAGWASRVLGYQLSPAEAARLLESMRHIVETVRGHTLTVTVPPFRADILGPIDLVEDIAIAVGYEKFYPIYDRPSRRGALLGITRLARTVRTVLLGLGHVEVMQLNLTSPRLLDLLGVEGVRVENPVQQEYSVLRPSLAPSLLQVAAANQHASKPVKVFEIGRIAAPSGGVIREDDRVGIMVMDSELSVEAVQAPLYALLRALGVEFTIVPGGCPGFLLEGRCGTLMLGGERLGYFGEVHPRVLEELGIEYPVAVAEVSLRVMLEWRSRTRSRG